MEKLSFPALVEYQRRYHTGEGKLVQVADEHAIQDLTEEEYASYLAALNDSRVFPEVSRLSEYTQHNFWYRYLKQQMRKENISLAEDFGREVDLRHYLPLSDGLDKDWVLPENKYKLRGPGTYYGHVLPGQIIDLINHGHPDLALLATIKIVISPSLSFAAAKIARFCLYVGIDQSIVSDRLFPNDYRQQTSKSYCRSVFNEVRQDLIKQGLS